MVHLIASSEKVLASSVRNTVRPDFVFHDSRVVVFIDGCFWHSCPKHGSIPATRPDFWKPKLNATRRRDRAVTACLRSAGWTVIRIWEHDILGNLEGHITAIKAATGQG